MQDSGVGIRGVRQIALTVADVARAKAFYRDTLGVQHLFDAPPGMTFFDVGGVRLLLGRAEDGGSTGASTIVYLDVPDIAAAHARLAERGVAFEQPPHHIADLGDRDLWLAFFRDSEQNLLGLMSEVPKSE
jgi:methylmalonyl-CoA/ethylmalonyl-CoA epimerase